MFQGLGHHLPQSDDLQATKKANTRPKKIPATQPYWITNYCWQLSCSHLPHHQMEEKHSPDTNAAAAAAAAAAGPWTRFSSAVLMSVVDVSDIGHSV